MKKKSNFGIILSAIIITILLIAGGIFALLYFKVIKYELPKEEIKENITEKITENKTQPGLPLGTQSEISVLVRDNAASDPQTTMAVKTYCIDDQGEWILDGVVSSKTAPITGNTKTGRKVTCSAFNSTFQSIPLTKEIDGTTASFDIQGYSVSFTAFSRFYDRIGNPTTLQGPCYPLGNKSCFGANITIASESSASFNKIRTTNNATNKWLPLGGWYFWVNRTSKFIDIDLSGSARLYGPDHETAQIIEDSQLTTQNSQRIKYWEFVAEIDDDPNTKGNQPVILEGNDYIETGPVLVKTSAACVAGADNGMVFAFAKGYYRSTTESSVKFGHEKDDSSRSLILRQDWNGSQFKCGP